MSKVLVGLDKSQSYRLYLTITTDMVEEARLLHETSPLATAGLGRVLTGAGLMAATMKTEEGKLTVNFKGDGPAGQILAVGNGKGQIKGYIANPNVELPLTEGGKLDVGGSLGIGDVTVIWDIGLKEPYSGNIALVTGEIADDLTAYYFISEQQNTSFALGVKVAKDRTVQAAGGMFIQMLPGGEEGAILALEKLLGDMKPLSTLIEEAYDQGKTLSEEGILELLKDIIFKEIDPMYQPETLDFKSIGWCCDCSKERMEKALIAIGKKDLGEILEEDGEAEMSCHFCGNSYKFEGKDLEDLLAQL